MLACVLTTWGLGATLIAAAAASVDIEVRNTPEQSRVARELGSALHTSKNLYENPRSATA